MSAAAAATPQVTLDDTLLAASDSFILVSCLLMASFRAWLLMDFSRALIRSSAISLASGENWVALGCPGMLGFPFSMARARCRGGRSPLGLRLVGGV